MKNWQEEADAALDRAIAWATRRGDRALTTDDLWRELERQRVPPPAEPRAVAGVMLRARAAGKIRGTDEYRKTVRPEAHGRPVRIWKVIPTKADRLRDHAGVGL
jgi:hypothetical protein